MAATSTLTIGGGGPAGRGAAGYGALLRAAGPRRPAPAEPRRLPAVSGRYGAPGPVHQARPGARFHARGDRRPACPPGDAGGGPEGNRDAVERQAEAAIARIDAKLTELARMRRALARLASECRGPHLPTACPLLAVLDTSAREPILEDATIHADHPAR